MNSEQVKAEALELAMEHGFTKEKLELAFQICLTIKRIDLRGRLARESLKDARKLHRKIKQLSALD